MSDSLDSRLVFEFGKKLSSTGVRALFTSCVRNERIRIVWEETASYHAGTIVEVPKRQRLQIKDDGIRFEGYFLAGIQAYFAIPCERRPHSFHYEKMLFRQPDVDDFCPPEWPQEYFDFIQYLKNTMLAATPLKTKL
jgi:hypothetical protein